METYLLLCGYSFLHLLFSLPKILMAVKKPHENSAVALTVVCTWNRILKYIWKLNIKIFNVVIFIFYRSSEVQYPFNYILRILIAFACFINNHKKSSRGIFEPGLCTSGYVTRVTRDLELTSPGVFPLVFTKQTTHFLFCQVLYQYLI